MRTYSLAYLTAHRSSVPEAIQIAAALGYSHVGLRLQPNAPGAPFQELLNQPGILNAALSCMRDTGVKVCDLEIIRIGQAFDPLQYRPLLEAGAALGAKAVLVAADDHDEHRLAYHYGQLCEFMQPFGLTADLEFMPWTGVKDARSALRVVRLAGSPGNAGILVDALHFGRSTTTLEDIAAIPRDLLHYGQMCDAVAGLNFTTEEMIHTARQERLLPGEGTIDVKNLFATLPADLPVSVEIPSFFRTRQRSDLEWAKLALDACQRILGDA